MAGARSPWEFKGQKLVVSVFEALQSDPISLLPADAYAWFAVSGEVRVICDYVAGMTDDFVLKTYDRLFSPRMGSVFDKLLLSNWKPTAWR